MALWGFEMLEQKILRNVDSVFFFIFINHNTRKLLRVRFLATLYHIHQLTGYKINHIMFTKLFLYTIFEILLFFDLLWDTFFHREVSWKLFVLHVNWIK